jgi:RNA polymerase sigma-70 factor (ECF subfamily)
VADHRRKLGRRGISLPLLETDAAAPSAEDLALSAGSISDAFGRLSPADRQVLSLIAFEGLSVAQAAVTLGISANSASQRIKRARERFAKQLANDLSDSE